MSTASRDSSGSTRSPRHRNQVNLSTIEKSVTHLLVATKQLLETLTAWSRQQATEAEVSDVYVRLGSEFNVACRAFTAIGVETADLGNVPDALRTILENTLSQDASPQSLDVYLPRIREIIINLLHGLKRKQQRLRQRQARENGDTASVAGSDRSSTASTVQSGRSSTRSTGLEQPTENEVPPRTTSLPSGSNSQRVPPQSGSSARTSSSRSHGHAASVSSSRSSPPPVTNGTPSIIAMPAEPTPAPAQPPPPKIEEQLASPPGNPTQFFPPPPPPPPSQDALAALQQHSSLERRASRRYSAYQIAKLTGKNPSDVPVLPTRDPSAIPRNRESMDAVRKRQNARSMSNSRVREESSPMRSHPNRIPEELSDTTDSPLAKTPEDKERPQTDLSATGPKPALTVDTGVTPAPVAQPEAAQAASPPAEEAQPSTLRPPSESERRGSVSSEQAKELTAFLQIGRSIKKVVLDAEELSMASLRLLFISKFNYNPPSGDDFPEIYLQDPVSGVRYELEDLKDVKDRAVLALNIEVLDEVKRHIDDGMGGIKQLLNTLSGSVESQALQISRVAERQEEAAKKIAELSVAGPALPPVSTSAAPSAIPSAAPSAAANTATAPASPKDSAAKLAEIQSLRKDLAVLRQVYSGFVADMSTSMATVKTKASSIKKIAAAGPNEGRAYVETGKKTLGSDADNLVTRVDDLQDIVEDLRKDVVLRGVRPLPRQLEQVSKEIAKARTELNKMTAYIKREKPQFRRVWERELEVVCEEQEFFNMQENLIADLADDLDKALQTFNLVEQCSEQQAKAAVTGKPRLSSRGLVIPDEGLDPEEAKGSVLNEVRALQPNHESRLEAIERAEKLRQKELAGRIPPFQKELMGYVAESRLKKSGGFEEAERQRIAKDESNRKAIWEFKLKMEEEESSEEEESGEEGEDDEEEDKDGEGTKDEEGETPAEENGEKDAAADDSDKAVEVGHPPEA